MPALVSGSQRNDVYLAISEDRQGVARKQCPGNPPPARNKNKKGLGPEVCPVWCGGSSQMQRPRVRVGTDDPAGRISERLPACTNQATKAQAARPRVESRMPRIDAQPQPGNHQTRASTTAYSIEFCDVRHRNPSKYASHPLHPPTRNCTRPVMGIIPAVFRIT